ncbi:hypothetical protein [Paenibacillus dendritiformis]|uniref:hypothetical protein n=1 Tax=Paenibacillus dendritiformis TaxID=130049 RepID=UPI00387E1AD5
MNFKLTEAIEVLERTPHTLENLLSGLPEGWLQCNEGVGKPFPPLDRYYHLHDKPKRSLEQKLLELKK